ncbi:MAG: glycosyltransferase [Sutterella sp.]|nr:glycosyltransferase [Sutterella sp.]
MYEKKKILVLSTFPIDSPRHGGQIRLDNIVKKYKNLGHDVILIGVLGSDQYPPNENFISYPRSEIAKVMQKSFALEDYAIFKIFEENDKLFKQLEKKIPWVPDIIHLELPWLYSFATKYLASIDKKIPLIYGSENIEHRLKEKILKDYINKEELDFYTEKIKNLEEEVIKKANINIAVSKSDKQWIESISGQVAYLLPNGVANRKITIKGETEFESLNLPPKFVLYCASAHLPNAAGLFKVFQPGLGCIQKDQALVIVGSCGQLILSQEKFKKIPLFFKRTRILQEVDEELLASLVQHAHTIILPIVDGEGTNLKTAEALRSSAYVVATATALRGFEEYLNEKRLLVSKSFEEFRKNIRYSLSQTKMTDNTCEKYNELLWDSTLEKLGEIILKLDKDNVE